MPKKGLYPFSSPKSADGSAGRKVQGNNGHSKPMNKVAAPGRNSKPVAVKLLDTGKKRPAVAKGPGVRAGTDAVSKPQRVRPL